MVRAINTDERQRAFLMELQDQVLRFPFAVDEIKKRGGQVKATCSYAKIKNGEILRD